ncbi:hypothetical protein PS710_06601 [Pseudomonas fluorescens]|uniref:Uncharacterized protein n=1 Tax=Pseudomonas fluorescens TaxID=294 RepID=A0A5E7G0X6_PSEFL|nr:hypothetical protein PS710_06601 [Pseudomonas fluorescens]
MDTRNCGTAKLTPATRIAGQISSILRQPAKAQISQNGTITEKNGNCRPTIIDSSISSSPVTLARVMIGVPKAPNATGAVLAINARPDAASGENPSPIRMAPVTATGVPNPAAPSKNAPKQKAISSNCSRRSSVMRASESCSTLNEPFSVVSRCRKMMLSTIQPIGSKPLAAPYSAAEPAMFAGMPKAKIAMSKAEPSAMSAARCALTWKNARAASITTTGTAAMMVENTGLPNGS